MIEFLKDYGWAVWLGGSLAAVGIDLFSWKYWVVSVPIIILVVVARG